MLNAALEAGRNGLAWTLMLEQVLEQVPVENMLDKFLRRTALESVGAVLAASFTETLWSYVSSLDSSFSWLFLS